MDIILYMYETWNLRNLIRQSSITHAITYIRKKMQYLPSTQVPLIAFF